jgi:hypothetical protein
MLYLASRRHGYGKAVRDRAAQAKRTVSRFPQQHGFT